MYTFSLVTVFQLCDHQRPQCCSTTRGVYVACVGSCSAWCACSCAHVAPFVRQDYQVSDGRLSHRLQRNTYHIPNDGSDLMASSTARLVSTRNVSLLRNPSGVTPRSASSNLSAIADI